MISWQTRNGFIIIESFPCDGLVVCVEDFSLSMTNCFKDEDETDDPRLKQHNRNQCVKNK